jgi:hypothetical protein
MSGISEFKYHCIDMGNLFKFLLAAEKKSLFSGTKSVQPTLKQSPQDSVYSGHTHPFAFEIELKVGHSRQNIRRKYRYLFLVSLMVHKFGSS